MQQATKSSAALLALHEAGLQLIPIVRGEKRPAIEDWPNVHATPSDIDRWLQEGKGVGLASANHPIIDVDVTTPAVAECVRNGVHAALGVLPTYRVGRAPKCAVICRTDEPFGKITLRLIRKSGGALLNDNSKPAQVELLGVGQQAVIFGTHPDTRQPYRFENGGRTGGVEMLVESVQAGLPKISGSWVRDTLLPALQRALAPANIDVEVVGASAVRKTDVDQERLRAPSIDALREAVAKTPNVADDRADYIKMLTAIRAAAGDAVDDGLTIAQEWAARWDGGANEPTVVEHDYRSLRPPHAVGFNWIAERARAFGFNDAALEFDVVDAAPAAPAEAEPPLQAVHAHLARFNTEAAIVAQTSGVLLTPPNGDPHFVTLTHAKTLFENRRVRVEGRRGFRDESLFKLWLESPERRTYNRVIFAPTLPARTGVQGSEGLDFNLFGGFAVEPSTSGSCDLFLGHLRENVASGDAAVYNWVIQWLAAIVQRPDRLQGTALVLLGVQGAGKTVVFEVMRAILGPALATTVSSPGELLGRFNSQREGKLLLGVEESFFAGDRSTVGRLKHLITAPVVSIERKGIEPYDLANYARLLITSNESWVVPAERGERRFMCVEVSSARAKDRSYFGAIHRQMRDGGYARLLDHLLHEVKVDWDLIAEPLASAALRDQQLASLPPDQQWLVDLAVEGRLPGDVAGDGTATADTLYDSYDRALKRRGRQASREGLGRLLKRHGIYRQRRRAEGSREYVYQFPSLQALRERVGHEFAVAPDWDDIDIWIPEGAALLGGVA